MGNNDVMSYEANCPHCGHEQFVAVHLYDDGKYLVQECSVDTGGCGKAYAVQPQITVKLRAYTLIPERAWARMQERSVTEWRDVNQEE